MDNAQSPRNASRDAVRLAVRELVIYRARYLTSKYQDEYALERWEDASAEYFNLTGRDHPMARYARDNH